MSVVLYSTNCPKCKVLEMKMKKKNIDYVVNNDISPLIEKGYKAAPVLLVGDSYKEFSEAVSWINEQ